MKQFYPPKKNPTKLLLSSFDRRRSSSSSSSSIGTSLKDALVSQHRCWRSQPRSVAESLNPSRLPLPNLSRFAASASPSSTTNFPACSPTIPMFSPSPACPPPRNPPLKSSNPPRAEGIDAGNDLDGDGCADLCHGGFRNLHHFFVVAGRYWDLRIGEEEERRRLKKEKSSLVGFFLGAKLF